MNRRAAVICALVLLLSPAAQPLPLPRRFIERRRGPIVQVRNIEGIEQQVQNGKVYLRIKDFVTLVLRNNTEINITRLDVMTAADAVLAARAPFDPKATFAFTGTRTDSPQFSQIGGAETLNNTEMLYEGGYQTVLGSGQTVGLGFSADRSSSNSRFLFLNPSILTGLNFQLTQPLLQNRNNIQLRAPLMIARSRVRVISHQSETRIADLVANAASQYWDAVQARDNIKVQQQAVNLAQKAYERDKLALDLGALPSLDIYQSQAQVAQRRVAVIEAQYLYRQALDGIRRLIGADLNPATRDIEIVLEDDPSALSVSALLNADTAIDTALRDRPELHAVRQLTAIDEISARAARDSMLPKLDLVGRGGGFGIGGNQIPVSGPLGIGGPTTFLPGGFSDSLGQLFGFRSPFYGVSLQLTIPFRSSAAQASLADALVDKARNQYQERLLKQQIIQEVKNAASQLEMANAQIDAARTARELVLKNVEAEQQKYELGSITAFELLDAQARLASVEGALLSAFVGYQKALVGYQRATWTLLDGMGVIVEAPVVR
jgi:outer membrane protein